MRSEPAEFLTPTITALLPYFGGKRSMADRIVIELGDHRSYWEVFCGAMAVLLAKPPCSQETVSDLYGDLINLALVIRATAAGRAGRAAEDPDVNAEYPTRRTRMSRTPEQLAVAMGAARDQIVAVLDEHEAAAHAGLPCLLERIGIVAFVAHAVGLPINRDIVRQLLEQIEHYARDCPQNAGAGKNGCRHPASDRHHGEGAV